MQAQVAASPDTHADGLLAGRAAPMRYDIQLGDVEGDEVHEVAGIIRTWMPTGVRVLDIGCGTGAVTLKVNRGKGNSVLAVEIDPTRAAIAEARDLEVFRGALDSDLLARRGPFDVIMLTDVLEHLPAPAHMLDLAREGLAEGGMILASVPNVAHWTVRLKLLLGRFDYKDSGIMDATHLRWFTGTSFVAFFERQNFRVVSVTAAPGTWNGVYRRGPFKLLPERLRHALVRVLTRALPGLFGCQIVVKAVPIRVTSSEGAPQALQAA